VGVVNAVAGSAAKAAVLPLRSALTLSAAATLLDRAGPLFKEYEVIKKLLRYGQLFLRTFNETDAAEELAKQYGVKKIGMAELITEADPFKFFGDIYRWALGKRTAAVSTTGEASTSASESKVAQSSTKSPVPESRTIPFKNLDERYMKYQGRVTQWAKELYGLDVSIDWSNKYPVVTAKGNSLKIDAFFEWLDDPEGFAKRAGIPR
jgi:hypothetical protein